MIEKSKYLFIAISLLLLSCQSNPWKGKKFYVLNCKLNGYIATLEEVQLNFISSEYIEMTATLNSSLGDIRTYKTDPSLGKLVKTYKYKSSNSDGVEMIDIPGLKLNFRTVALANGDRKASNGEMFYTQSIVEILGTEKAKERVIKSSPSQSLSHVYLRMLRSEKTEEVKIKEEQSEGFEGE
ncbi:hypothetical protein [Pedobacter sp. BMA]|uniref:hypothetical protein n=1 Tax=Pedobacter sp. BMA TaxID=1663685 RepID=UPI00064B21F5|nr:hypothetical protein [Pedobacter sp. BMA]KLT64016.1 hypothetical protein AB669_18285 [Pedobacter sp. BMA]